VDHILKNTAAPFDSLMCLAADRNAWISLHTTILCRPCVHHDDEITSNVCKPSRDNYSKVFQNHTCNLIAGNLAFYKPATQIGTYNGQSASQAVDNDPTGTCCFSESGDNNSPAWWQVDLQHECYITSVSIQFPGSSGKENDQFHSISFML